MYLKAEYFWDSEKVISAFHVYKPVSEWPQLNTQYSINTLIMLSAPIPILQFSSFLTVPALVKSVNFKATSEWMERE